MAFAGLGSPTTPSTVAPSFRRMPSPYSRRPRASSQLSSTAPCWGTYTPPPALPTPVAARSPASAFDRGVAGTSRVNRQSSSLAIRSLTKSEISPLASVLLATSNRRTMKDLLCPGYSRTQLRERHRRICATGELLAVWLGALILFQRDQKLTYFKA